MFVRAFRAGGSEHYNAQGQLMGLADTSGNITNLTRDGSGVLLSISDPGGRSLLRRPRLP